MASSNETCNGSNPNESESHHPKEDLHPGFIVICRWSHYLTFPENLKEQVKYRRTMAHGEDSRHTTRGVERRASNPLSVVQRQIASRAGDKDEHTLLLLRLGRMHVSRKMRVSQYSLLLLASHAKMRIITNPEDTHHLLSHR